MPFIGNTPDVNFTSFAKQDLTGVTGSPAKRGYTLSHAVANANEIEVFVNNVRQEPTESYTVNGTGLTMTGDVETSDDFYIIYLGKAIQTTVPPDGSVSTAKIASSAVDLTSKVTGVLPIANGGTGATAVPITTEIITNNTSGGTGVSEIVLDLSTDTKYLYQRFVIENMFSSTAQDVFIRVRKASDNSYYSGATDYGFAYMYATSAGASGGGNNDAANGRINGHAIGNDSAETSIWTIDVYNNTASGTGKGTSLIWNRFGWNSSYHAVIENGTTTLRPSTIEPTNQFKIYPGSSGTLTYSGFVHYGIKRA